MNVTIIKNSIVGGPGLVGRYLARRERTVVSTVTYREIADRAATATVDADMVIILGSPRGVYEIHEDWIRREHVMAEDLLRRGVPTFGICFGAQLLASVLGGTVRRMGRAFRDWHECDVAPSETWRGPWLRWHGDRIHGPDCATVISSAEGILQAFSHGSVVGVQFHPEVTQEILGGWIASLPDVERQHATTNVLAYYAANVEAIEARSFELFDSIFGMLSVALPGKNAAADGRTSRIEA